MFSVVKIGFTIFSELGAEIEILSPKIEPNYSNWRIKANLYPANAPTPKIWLDRSTCWYQRQNNSRLSESCGPREAIAEPEVPVRIKTARTKVDGRVKLSLKVRNEDLVRCSVMFSKSFKHEELITTAESRYYVVLNEFSND